MVFLISYRVVYSLGLTALFVVGAGVSFANEASLADSAAPEVSTGSKKGRFLGRLLPSLPARDARRPAPPQSPPAPPAVMRGRSVKIAPPVHEHPEGELDSACPDGLAHPEAGSRVTTRTQTRFLLGSRPNHKQSATAAVATVGMSASPQALTSDVSGDLQVHFQNLNTSIDNLGRVLNAPQIDTKVAADQLQRLQAEIVLMRREKDSIAVDEWIRLDVVLARLEHGISFIGRGLGNPPDRHLTGLGLERLRSCQQSLSALGVR